jgi:hypothetical protein
VVVQILPAQVRGPPDRPALAALHHPMVLRDLLPAALSRHRRAVPRQALAIPVPRLRPVHWLRSFDPPIRSSRMHFRPRRLRSAAPCAVNTCAWSARHQTLRFRGLPARPALIGGRSLAIAVRRSEPSEMAKARMLRATHPFHPMTAEQRPAMAPNASVLRKRSASRPELSPVSELAYTPRADRTRLTPQTKLRLDAPHAPCDPP